jgi:hypothetical protein
MARYDMTAPLTARIRSRARTYFSGLGAALELDSIFNKELKDKWGGGAKITVIEKANAISSYDPNKGFMYLISELGLKFTVSHGISRVLSCRRLTCMPFGGFSLNVLMVLLGTATGSPRALGDCCARGC